jgi:CRP-like cAMP-binding protein
MSEEEIGKRLARNDLFAGLDPDEIRFLSGCAKHRHFAKDHVVFRHGDKASSFFLIVSGTISIEVPAISGPTLFLQHLEAGQMLGWSWMIPPYKWSFLARAETDVEALEFDGVAVLARCEEDPKFGYHLLKAFSGLMSQRLAHARQRMMEEWQATGFG